MSKNTFVIGIISLFILSAVTPIVFGYEVSTTTEELIDEKESQPAITSDGGPMESAWPMFQHNIRHTGYSPYGKSGNWYVEKWKTHIGDWAASSPAIDNNGIIYVGGGIMDECLYAVYPDGTEKWRFKTGEHVQSSPAIAEDGTIYVGSNDGKLYAIYPNGTKKWSLGIGSSWVYSSPVIDEEGIIYVASVGGNICAVYPNGSKKWDVTLGGWVYCRSPGLDNDGAVYCGANDGCMYSIYTNNGTVKWKYGTGGEIGSAPTIDDNGTIYFGSNDGYLYALYPNGTLKWRFLTRKFFGLTSSPAIAKDGNIIVGSGLGYVYSINPDNGTENWRFSAGDQVSASPAIDKYGVIYVGAWNGMFYALNPDGTLRWKYQTLEGIIPSAAIGDDGTIYVGADCTLEPEFYSYLYAIEPIDDTPPDKPNINGPTSGKPGEQYWFTAVTSDPDGHNIKYGFDWNGDGTVDEWTQDYYESGETVEVSHSWNKRGTYDVKVKAKDVYELEGEWSDPHTITIPRNKVKTYNSLIARLLEKLPIFKHMLQNVIFKTKC